MLPIINYTDKILVDGIDITKITLNSKEYYLKVMSLSNQKLCFYKSSDHNEKPFIMNPLETMKDFYYR